MGRRVAIKVGWEGGENKEKESEQGTTTASLVMFAICCASSIICLAHHAPVVADSVHARRLLLRLHFSTQCSGDGVVQKAVVLPI